MTRLADALVERRALAEPMRAEAVALTQAKLERGPLGLVEAMLDTTPAGSANLLVLVDQFEEIFRFRKQGNADEADAFVRLLLASAAQRDQAIYVVLTMRSDFLGHCALFMGLPEAINGAQYLTPRLTREQCREAIEGPARVCGGSVDAQLTTRLLNDFGNDPDQLPLLQHALMRMWARRLAQGAPDPTPLRLTVDDYVRVGNLQEALAAHAEEVMEAIPQPQHFLVEKLFRCLVERESDERDVRRPCRLGEVVAVAGLQDVTALVPVVDAFRAPECNFIIASRDVALSPRTLLDISHEALIRRWPRLSQWVRREGADAVEYRRMLDEARRWERHEAELWGGVNLDRGLEWLKAGLNAAWAERYSLAPASAADAERRRLAEEEVALVRRFLSEASAAREAARAQQLEERERRQREEIDRQTEKERARRFEAEAKAGRAFKRWAAVLGVLLVVLFVVAGIAWQQRQDALSAADKARRQTLEAENARRQAEDRTKELLLQFGWQSDRVATAAAGGSSVDQSLKANQAIQQAAARAPAASRGNVVVQYFPKNVDGNRVEAALTELGFRLDRRSALVPALPTNSIWYGTPVALEDVKLVALTLIRAGVQIRAIRPFPDYSPRKDASLIQVGADVAVADRPPLTVDAIRDGTAFHQGG